MKKLIALLACGFLFACNNLIMDTSLPAVQAGDLTVVSACDYMPGRGADICRFKDGAKIQSDWKIILPFKKDVVKSGYAVVTYKDYQKQYNVTSNVISIPWKDVVGGVYWDKTTDSFQTAQVRAKITYQGNTTLEEVQLRGFALIVITDKSYDPLPIDSGVQAFQTKCTVQYTSAGRSALVCN